MLPYCEKSTALHGLPHPPLHVLQAHQAAADDDGYSCKHTHRKLLPMMMGSNVSTNNLAMAQSKSTPAATSWLLSTYTVLQDSMHAVSAQCQPSERCETIR